MEEPPSYDAATSGTTNTPSKTVPHEANGSIPPMSRRSMEDEGRPLPQGWIRQYDPDNHHQFFVDTNLEPPRSIWQHPYDDVQYLNSLSPTERQRVNGLLKVPTSADIGAMSSDDEGEAAHHKAGAASASHPPGGVTRFGRKVKDKITGTTHEQREEQRIERAKEEQRMYEEHQRLRQALSRAAQTGQPQLIGKDRHGKDIYLEPPNAYGGQPGAYGYNPYTQGPYANPNATFVRPRDPYSRPYGGGYGGGYGLPLAGGLLGGALLGGALFGGF